MADVANLPLSPARYGGQLSVRRPGNLAGAIIAIALHVVAVVALLQYEPVRSALSSAVPLMVSLITPPIEKPTVLPKPLPMKPKVERIKPIEPPPVLTATAEAPSPQVAPPPPPVPVPVEIIAPPAPPAPVVRVIPPNFNADYLKNPPPVYPAAARRQGQQGRVTLRVLVNAAGGADQVEIRNSSGHRVLDSAAQEAVRQWKFVPARQGDQPVAAWVLVPITFTLEG